MWGEAVLSPTLDQFLRPRKLDVLEGVVVGLSGRGMSGYVGRIFMGWVVYVKCNGTSHLSNSIYYLSSMRLSMHGD